MDVLDVVIVILLFGAAVHGVRLGAAIQLISFVGFLVGLAVGVGLVLLIDPHVSGQLTKTLVALALLLVPAAVVGGAGRQAGNRLWLVLHRARFGLVDAISGGLIAVASTLVVCWLFASILVNSAFPAVSREIESSRIIRGVASIMPPIPNTFATVERYLSTSGFPQVLVNVLPESVGPVELPNTSQFDAAVAAASSSTVKVVTIGCGEQQEGSGFISSDLDGSSLVVTNAHVVAGTQSITVEAPDGRSSPAVTVLFDPKFDLAVLRTSPLPLPALPIDAGFVQRGEPAVVLGYPGGGPFTADRAGVVSRFKAEGRDIYDSAITERVVYELEALVRPGNSGGPLVTPNGEVIGVVFSRSASEPNVGYALASPGVLQRVDEARAHPYTSVGTGACMEP